MTLSPDMGPPSDEVEPYDVPRGTCPKCGSRAVRHLLIGYPAHPEALDSLPAWVDFVGCLHPGHDRECRRCGLEWLDEEPTEAGA